MTSRISPSRLFALLALTVAGFFAAPAYADPADIDAAARGVVRVVVVGRDGDAIFPISHGTGFAVDAETIVTNAHVVGPAIEDDRLSIGIVPSDGGEAVYGRVMSVSPRNDLALITTTSPLRLPPLTIAGNPPTNAGTVIAVGYPMNVDQAQGLGEEDIFRAQPPVTSPGFLSGRRPSREFDTVLHTAPIARGNSGGPLLDECGRVIGVNSFGAESQGTEAEFFFAVTVRELLPFLRANEVTPRINSMPCRSLTVLDAEERERARQRLQAAQEAEEADEQARAQRRAEIRREIEFSMLDERANGLALSLLLFIIFAGGTAYAADAHRRGDFRARSFAGSAALLALVSSGIAWLSRPSFEEVEERLEERLRDEMAAEETGVIIPAITQGTLTCTLDAARSRVLGAPVENLVLGWQEGGCFNGQTQYGLNDDEWSRVLVPANEEAVSISRYNAGTREYIVERYLLDRNAMSEARAARAQIQAPMCDSGVEAARILGDRQMTIVATLPQRPNERLVYACELEPEEDSVATE
jgi:hypothetical protein